MLRTRLTAGLLLLALQCVSIETLSAQPATDRPAEQKTISAQVTQLIRQLDDQQRMVRQRAELELVELGKPVLSLLPAPELVASQSVREALQRVRLQIEKRAARNSIKASRINLQGRFSLKQVLQAIARQTENQLDWTQLTESQLKQNIDVQFVETPFWKVIDELTVQLPLTYRINGPRDQLQFQLRSDSTTDTAKVQEPVCYNGPFRISIDHLQCRPLAGSEDQELLRITFLIQVEPRLRPLFLSYAARKLKAEGAKGTILPPYNPGAKYELPLGEGGKNLKFTMQWILKSGQRPQTIQVHGNLEMELAAETLPITFRDLFHSQGAIRRRGNVSVELVEAERNEKLDSQNLTIRIALSYDYGGPAFESHRTWIYHNRAYLQDAQGKKFWLDGSSQTTLESTGKIGVVYRFTGLPGSAKPDQFTYLAPTLITAAPIELSFEKLDLPEPKPAAP
ncbi:hypothetical protein [Gimesia panareensis]|uniref:hypothetical protein n=1 Tax=Gimesia panareensis TaxID=2527978 RepID=UPI00118D468D|nr:hypothetical protein [Gimesia panareensis]QDU52644.1 hypothetical protein Pan110_50240 [Gimesia panareensis]